MNRKFSDSELRAYSKNRFEERILKQRLEKLKEEFGEYHELTAKQRADLINENKTIRKTTGGTSKSSDDSVFDDDEAFDLSKRLNRPWAYSSMDTTHNVVYKEAVIPPPRKRSSKFRSKSASALSRSLSALPRSRPSTTASTPRQRTWSSKSYGTPDKSLASLNSDESGDPRLQYSRCTSNPEMRINDRQVFTASGTSRHQRDDKLDAIHELSFPQSSCPGRLKSANAIGKMNGNEKHNEHDSIDGVCSSSVDEKITLSPNDIKINSNKEDRPLSGSVKSTNSDSVEETLDLKENANLSTCLELGYDTRLIRLPPVHEIDSKAYQQAEREREAARARSRVSFSQNVSVVVQPRDSNKSTSNPDKRVATAAERTNPDKALSETKESGTTNQPKAQENGVVQPASQMNVDELKTVESLKTVAIHDDDNATTTDMGDNKLVKYKGKTIHNYIRPEERYKLDPIILKRRQTKMDRLAKESITFLKRVNHENIRVEIAFPRSARRRLLTRLVEDNNSGKGRKFEDTEGPVIQSKIQQFMASMTDYIHYQRTEAAKWHT